MSKVIIYHNPKCSKSRETLELLEGKGVNIEIREYLVSGLQTQDIKLISDTLNLPIIDFIRKKEEEYKVLSIDWTDMNQATDALINNPKILERPIVIKGTRAIIGRPPENIEKLF
jgi:arsenate reductase